jgi:hypothetical protein
LKVGSLTNTPEGHLVHQQSENQSILVRLFLAKCRDANGEGFAAYLAAIALGP